MPSQPDYRLVLRSDGEALLLRVEGGVDASVGRHVREVTAAAAKLGIPVRVEHDRSTGDVSVTGSSHGPRGR